MTEVIESSMSRVTISERGAYVYPNSNIKQIELFSNKTGRRGGLVYLPKDQDFLSLIISKEDYDLKSAEARYTESYFYEFEKGKYRLVYLDLLLRTARYQQIPIKIVAPVKEVLWTKEMEDVISVPYVQEEEEEEEKEDDEVIV